MDFFKKKMKEFLDDDKDKDAHHGGGGKLSNLDLLLLALLA